MAANVDFEFRHVAFNQRMLTFAIVNREHSDVRQFLREACEYYENEIRSVLLVHNSVKVKTMIVLIFEKVIVDHTSNDNANHGDDDENHRVLRREYQTVHIHTDNIIVERDTNLSELFEESVLTIILLKIDEAIMKGSGFTLSSIEELVVEVNRYDPIRGSSYIKTPKFLADKRAIVNVENEDEKCFMWAILSALHYNDIKSNRKAVKKYEKYENELNFNGIEFPVQINSINKFEKLNVNIAINVYMYDSNTKKIRPLRISKQINRKCIHLMLLMAESEDPNPKHHYCYINDLSRLVSSQISNHKAKAYLCDRCLNQFRNSDKLQKHIGHCANQNEYQIEVPTPGNDIIEFKHYKNQVICPYVIYADVEALLKTPTENFCKNGVTKAIQEHEVYSVGYYLKCSYDDNKSYYKAERGSDCLDWFVNELLSISDELTKMFGNIVPLRMSADDNENFLRASKCHICEKKFNKHADVIVRDHCHFTGKFRGAAHQDCNLQYRDYRTVPVIFHNLSHYDSHFIIQKIAQGFDGSIKIIPINTEKYISFIKTVPNSSGKFKEMIKFKFIDSFRFMPASLDYLASLIPSEKKTLLRKEFKNLSDDQICLLERKGVFCYDYVDSWQKLEETTLPQKELFFSRLTNEDISDGQYTFANEIWEKFNIKTLGEYADLYLRVDVCLLAIVFENLRETCYKLYKLDPANYYTAPGLSFDAMLRFTKAKLELPKDVDMVLLIERGIRGGISQCSKRYVKANNKYMDTYDKSKKSTFIMYVDCNNLYGFVMMQHLPISGYQTIENCQFTAEDILKMADDASEGYIFEVDLEYPEHCHDLHSDYPFCSENTHVPDKKNVKKLLLTLDNKKNYVIHYRMLKLALQHGLILQKVHSALKFKQSAWMKPYIELNTKKREQATNGFEKDYYKLKNNSVFGKTMENIRKRIDIHLRTTWDGRCGVRKLVAMPNFKRATIFDENFVAVEMKKTNILMDKPIAVGMAVLDISKVVMYEYYYNFLKKRYGDQISLVYTDTDSFVLEVETDDFYADMKQNLERYDTSDYPKDNKFNMPQVNKKVPGLFKDELNGEIITEFVGLRSKMYCVKTGSVDKMKKAKGVKKCVLKKEIGFDDYLDCLKNGTSIKKNQTTFRTKLHKMYTIEQSKIALSSHDDKRYIVTCEVCKNGSCTTCNFQTLAHGHYKIKQQISNDDDDDGDDVEEDVQPDDLHQNSSVKRPRSNDEMPEAKRSRTTDNADAAAKI